MDTRQGGMKTAQPRPPKELLRISAALLAVGLALVVSPATNAAEELPAGVKSAFVDAGHGVRIHYLQAGAAASGDRVGQKPSLLFIPGWTMPAWIWEAQIEYFSKAFHVVAIDPRSQGESTHTDDANSPEIRAGDIQAVIEDRKLIPVVLIGWSQGVADVLAYVDRFGQKNVSAVVLVDGLAGFDADAGMAQAFMGIYSAMLKDRDAYTRGFVKSMFKSAPSDEYISRLTAAAEQTPTAATIAESVSMVAIDRRPTLAKISVPTLIVTPKGGYTASFEEDIHKHVPHSQIEEMENVGHALFVDDPKTFNHRLEIFLQPISK
ncbi:MAG: alpha/beta hydrolase [Candidatus Acidiferrales bacterium]